MSLDDAKPDFVNPEGTKWWRYPDLDAKQIKLSGWRLETADGEQAYVLIQGKEPVFDSPNLEAVAVHRDILIKLAEDEA